jgi:hypothetical protein
VTLRELSEDYRRSGELLRVRLRELRRAARDEPDREARWHLQRRIAALSEMQRQVNELTILTARYYERSYHKNEKYTL